MPDIAIVEELRRRGLNDDVRFVSYGTGATTFRQAGYPVIDLKMPDNNPFLDTIIYCTQVISRLKPDLVIAHEEVAAMVAASAFDNRTIFITDFFQEPTMLSTKALEFADELIFIGDSDVFTEPPSLRDKIKYVGPLVRPLQYTRADRSQARSELGLEQDTTLISCMPGSWSEAGGPIASLVCEAFNLLPTPSKVLWWIAGADYERLTHDFRDRKDVIVVRDDPHIDRLMVASDVVITKSNRVTLRELNALGVPSISLSHGANWPDDVVAKRINTNTLYDVRGMTPLRLREYMEQSLQSGTDHADRAWPKGLNGAADRLSHHIHALRGFPVSESRAKA